MAHVRKRANEAEPGFRLVPFGTGEMTCDHRRRRDVAARVCSLQEMMRLGQARLKKKTRTRRQLNRRELSVWRIGIVDSCG